MSIEPLTGAQTVQSLAPAMELSLSGRAEKGEKVPDSESLEASKKAPLPSFQGTMVDTTA